MLNPVQVAKYRTNPNPVFSKLCDSMISEKTFVYPYTIPQIFGITHVRPYQTNYVTSTLLLNRYILKRIFQSWRKQTKKVGRFY